jgi:hypothetical protein
VRISSTYYNCCCCYYYYYYYYYQNPLHNPPNYYNYGLMLLQLIRDLGFLV